MPNESNRWKIATFFLALAVLVAVVAIAWMIEVRGFNGGRTEYAVTMMLADEHAAAWIVHDNAFTYEKSNPTKFRSGLVFQVGDYFDYRENKVVLPFEGVTLMGANDTVKLELKDFDWINIVGEDGSKAEPLSLNHVGLLYPDATTGTECSDIEACVMEGAPCLVSAESSKTSEMIPGQCVRSRSIDARFQPKAVITYWQGANSYDIRGIPTAEHNKFKFGLKDPVTVTVYKDGKPVSLDLGEIHTIHISEHDHPKHGEVHDPGMGGGKTPQ